MLVSDLGALAAPARLLLDTGVWGHVMMGDTGVLTNDCLVTIERAAHERRLFVSAASLWDIARQVERGALAVDDLPTLVANQQRPPGVTILPIDTDVLLEAHRLPAFTPTRDPITRFIAASARRTGATVVTTDPSLIAIAGTGAINTYDARA